MASELSVKSAEHLRQSGFDRGGRRILGCVSRGCATLVALLVGAGIAASQPAPQPARPAQAVIDPDTLPRGQRFPARIAAAAQTLKDHPDLKRLTPEQREKAVAFMVGNMLFVVLHELAHTAITDLKLPVLGREEDAADDFAIVTLLRVGSEFTHRVLSEATKGWFFSARRDRKDGEPLVFYDEHSLDQQRAYHIVCLLVGHNPSDIDMIDLANEMALPEERRESCKKDFATASSSWDMVLKDHRRAADQPRMKIDIAYGDGDGELALYAQGFRSVRLLEVVANRYAEDVAWPAPFALEMKSCGFINARWVGETRILTLCYELAQDFAELYRDFNKAPNTKVAGAKSEPQAKPPSKPSARLVRSARPALRGARASSGAPGHGAKTFKSKT